MNRPVRAGMLVVASLLLFMILTGCASRTHPAETPVPAELAGPMFGPIYSAQFVPDPVAEAAVGLAENPGAIEYVEIRGYLVNWVTRPSDGSLGIGEAWVMKDGTTRDAHGAFGWRPMGAFSHKPAERLGPETEPERDARIAALDVATPVSIAENPETTETLVFGYLIRLYPAEGRAWDMYVSTDAQEGRMIDLDAPRESMWK